MSHNNKEAAISLRTTSAQNGTPAMAGTLALAISAALSTQYAHAEEVKLDTLVVEEHAFAADANPYAEPGAPYKAKKLSDSRHTRDIADTPQTMTVLTKDLITESGKTELEDLLSAQPGITLGTGEGGNSFGDRYIIRGYEARSDVYTDGLREPGLITRETFALEQVEIAKGPSSTFAGRGSTGGAVNTITKQASLSDDFTTAEAGLGSDRFQRYTLDSNHVISDETAVRLNLLYTEKDTPNRAPAGEQRDGVLASVVHQASDDLTLSADLYHFRADDRTDPGHAYDRDTGAFNAYDYIGQDGLDYHESDADVATVSVDYAISDDTRLENKTRWGQTANDYVVSAYSSRSGSLRSFTGWQENDYIGNQTNLIIDRELAGKRHTIVAGAEYAKEGVITGSNTVTTDSLGSLDPYNATHNLWSGSVSRNSAAADLDLKTLSAYLMDTVALNDQLELFGGLRYDHFDYKLWAAERTNRRTGVVTPETTYSFSDSFVNGHLGLVYSPWEHGNVYASWSTSSNINGGEADAALNCGYGGLCTDADGNYQNAEPEQSTNYEIGTKWNLLDESLLFTAALFQTTKDKVIEGGNDSYASGGSLNTGKNRVEGVEFGLSGNLTPKLSAQFGLALMDSETLESFDSANIGLPKANFAEKSANLQLRYQLTPAFAFGGTLTYSSEIYGGQPDAGSTQSVVLPAYRVYDLFASYEVNDDLSLQANIQNLTDETYYTAVYRGGSIAYLGDGRSASLSLKYRF